MTYDESKTRCKMVTYTGREFNPLELKESDVCLSDVAHALALVNRFGGHTQFPISVAQHAVYVSWLCEAYGVEAAWQALHHDDSEYLLGDMTKWVKRSDIMAGYRAAEERVQMVCYDAFGCSTANDVHVRWADDLMVRFEAEMAYDKFTFDDLERYPPLTRTELDHVHGIGMPLVIAWSPWSWEYAEEMFLMQAHKLERRRL